MIICLYVVSTVRRTLASNVCKKISLGIIGCCDVLESESFNSHITTIFHNTWDVAKFFDVPEEWVGRFEEEFDGNSIYDQAYMNYWNEHVIHMNNNNVMTTNILSTLVQKDLICCSCRAETK